MVVVVVVSAVLLLYSSGTAVVVGRSQASKQGSRVAISRVLPDRSFLELVDSKWVGDAGDVLAEVCQLACRTS